MMNVGAIVGTIVFGHGIWADWRDISPTLVGVLLTMDLPAKMNFSVIEMAAVIGGIAVLFVQEEYASYKKESGMAVDFQQSNGKVV